MKKNTGVPKMKNPPPPPPPRKIGQRKRALKGRRLIDFIAVTNLTKEEIEIELNKLKSNTDAVFNFYLATARFPVEIEDKFIYEYGFTNWHNAYKFGILKKF